MKKSVNDSIRYIATLEDLGKTWIHLKQGYAFIINKYCSFLVFKLKFHKKVIYLFNMILI